ARLQAEITTSGYDDMHGGELETAILLHAHPERVEQSHAVDHTAHDRRHLLITGMTGYTESGIIGRPSCVTAAKGRVVLDSLSNSFGEHLKVLVDRVDRTVS